MVDNHITHLLPKVTSKPFRKSQYTDRMSPIEMHKGLDFINKHFFPLFQMKRS